MSKQIHIGLAQWHHPKWYHQASANQDSLRQYSNSFSTVEGNTSFYAIPSREKIQLWNDISHNQFQFCFKFHRDISHKQSLTHCSRQVVEFLNRISLLNTKLGVIWLQLNQNFSAQSLDVLEKFLSHLPMGFRYGVEVRHLSFFNKDDNEKRFNQILQNNGVNRVMFDTRSLFSHTEFTDSATLEALSAKPRVPTHVVATGENPFVRFIVPMDYAVAEKEMMQWVVKAEQWIKEGRIPYFFFHTPDNEKAPQVAELFNQKLLIRMPELAVIKLWGDDSKQSELF